MQRDSRMATNYVIITAAYNEAKYISATINSVLAQTIRPLIWLIVDDGSTDGTREVVEQFAGTCPFIRYYRRERVPGQAYFASNVHALMEGVRHIEDVEYDFLAVLDADIVLPDDYYEQIMARFATDARLGVASGIYQNLVNGELQAVLNDRRSTPKAIQVFRRACFEDIGGYVPLKHGGEDTCACIMARMKGWKSWSFPELVVVHHRPTGTGNGRGVLRARFIQGLGEYGMATHPLFMIAKSVRRCVIERPFLVGGIARLGGYLYGHIRREPRQISRDVIKHARREQLGRLIRFNRHCKKDGPQVNVGSAPNRQSSCTDTP